jgi:uncharacterized protein
MSVMLRVVSGLALLALVSAVAFGGHLYIAERLVFDPGLAGAARVTALAIIGGGFACLLATPFVERLVPAPWSRIVTWPGSIWMGVAFLSLVVLGSVDLLRWIAGGVAYAAGNTLADTEYSARLQALGS